MVAVGVFVSGYDGVLGLNDDNNNNSGYASASAVFGCPQPKSTVPEVRHHTLSKILDAKTFTFRSPPKIASRLDED